MINMAGRNSFAFFVCITFFHLYVQVKGDEAGGDGVDAMKIGENKDKACAAYGGHYFRGIFCCKGKYIKTREELFYFSPQFKTCLRNTSKASENQDDHLPPLLWKAYLCVLRSTSAFPDEINFQAYVNHMTSDYTPEIQKEVRAANTECVKADEEKEDWKRILRFAECFHQKEKEVCHHPTEEFKAKQQQFLQNLASRNITISNVSPTCSPLDDSKTPYDDCCQKTPIPLSMTHLLSSALVSGNVMHRGMNISTVRQCSLTFMTRQKKLIEAMEANGTASGLVIRQCPRACLFVPKVYDGPENLELNSTLMELNWYAKSLLPDSFPQKLEEAFKYNFNKRILTVSTRKLTCSELIKEFKETKDEWTKIQNYCEYYNLIDGLMEMSFRQYCTDTEWMNKASWMIKG